MSQIKLCIFIFLIIFYFIFQGFDFSKVLSITLSLIIFSTPSLINFLNFNSIPYIYNLMSFYTLRFPKPLVSSLFFCNYYFTFDNNDILMLSINKIFYNLLKIKFKSDLSASRIEKTEIL